MFHRQSAVSDPRAAMQRRQADFMARHIAKQTGADERKAAAEAKRARRNAKRADANCMKMPQEVYG